MPIRTITTICKSSAVFRLLFISALTTGLWFTNPGLETVAVYAQQGDRKIVTVVTNFAFDAPIFLTNAKGQEMNAPVSLQTMTSSRKASSSYSNLTILGADGLWFADNQPIDGYLGFDETQLGAELSLNASTAKHILTDIDQYRGVDALVFVPGTKELFTILGTNQEIVKTTFERRIQDVAAVRTARPTPIHRTQATQQTDPDRFWDGSDSFRSRKIPTLNLAILHDRYVHFIPSTRLLENPAGSVHAIRAEIVSFAGKGHLITGYTENNHPFYAVAGDFRNRLGLKLLTSSADTSLPGVKDTAYLHTSSAETEEFVKLAMANLDDDLQPEVVLLTTVQLSNGIKMGRLRIFDVTSTLTLEVLNIWDIELSASLSKDIAGNQISNNQNMQTTPTALRLADIAPAQGRGGADGNIDVIIAGNVSDGAKYESTQRPFVQIWSNSRDGTWMLSSETVVDDTVKWVADDLVNQPFAINPYVTDVEVGHYNADNLADVILSDSENDGLILLKQQPQPCLTFITSITHGHQGEKSIQGTAGLNRNRVAYNDGYNGLLSDEVQNINAARRTPRTGQPELCPVAHIAVNGHWEAQTVDGAWQHVAGRGGWLVGSLVPSPACFRALPIPINPRPHLKPIPFWLSSLWLVMPSPPPPFNPSDCIPLFPDYASQIQFAVAGIGAGVEWWGRTDSSQASIQAADDLAGTIDAAVGIARTAMDSCTGQVMLDTFGFSRGTTVTSEALRRINTQPLQYNADVSLTVIDAIDPSWGPPYRGSSCSGTLFPNGDSIRPWAKSGYIVGDPPVMPAGSAKVSSIYSGDPGIVESFIAPIASQFTPLLADLAELAEEGIGLGLCPQPNQFNFERDLVGMPSGYDRRNRLTVVAGGSFASADTLSHLPARDNFFGQWEWIDTSSVFSQTTPASFTAQPGGYTSLSLNDAFSFANVTHMGRFFRNPRAPIPDLPGWLRNQPPNQPFPADDSDRLPPICPRATGSGPTEDTTNPGEAVSAANNVRDDEFVSDSEFNFSRGMVENATELIEIDNLLPDEKKEYRLDALFPLTSTVILDFIRNTATAGFPVFPNQSGGWTVVDPPASCASQGTGNCIRLGSFSTASRTEQFAARLLAPLIPPGVDLSDAATMTENISALSNEWRAATLEDNGDISADRVNLYQQVLSGGSRLDDAFVQFPAQEATLRQMLELGSRSHTRLVVRVFYAMPGNTGTLDVHLNGHNLDVTESVDFNGTGFRRELMFIAKRDGEPDFGVPDTLELSGRDVRLFAVSVRAETPQRNPVNGHYYDYLVFDGGTDWEAAQAIAQRWTYRGRKGHLATFSGADAAAAFHELWRMFRPDTYVWLGAKGTPTDKKAFDWIQNVPFNFHPWHPGTLFDPNIREERYLFAYPNSQFGHAPLSVTKQGRPFGFFIDYGP